MVRPSTRIVSTTVRETLWLQQNAIFLGTVADNPRETNREKPKSPLSADESAATRTDMSDVSCGIGFCLGVQPNGVSVATASIGLPDAHSVSGGEIELVSGLYIECRVPCVEVAHSDRPELVGGMGVGHHLLPEKSFTRL